MAIGAPCERIGLTAAGLRQGAAPGIVGESAAARAIVVGHGAEAGESVVSVSGRDVALPDPRGHGTIAVERVSEFLGHPGVFLGVRLGEAVDVAPFRLVGIGRGGPGGVKVAGSPGDAIGGVAVGAEELHAAFGIVFILHRILAAAPLAEELAALIVVIVSGAGGGAGGRFAFQLPGAVSGAVPVSVTLDVKVVGVGQLRDLASFGSDGDE